MNKPVCPKCGSIETLFSYGFCSDCMEFTGNGKVIIYFWCRNCDVEFQVIYYPEEKSIVSEPG